MKLSTNYKTIHKIVYWIVTSWFSDLPNSIELAATWINQVNAWHLANGPIWTIKQIKMIRLIVFSYLSDKPLKEVNQIIGINRSNCLPKSITYLHKYIESREVRKIRFVLTLLSISRAIPGWAKPNLSTITTPSNPNKVQMNLITDYMDEFLQKYNWNFKIPMYFDRTEIVLSTKSGPNGTATRTALVDLWEMPEELKTILKGTNLGPIMTEYESLLSPNRVWKYHTVVTKWKEYMKLKIKTISFFDTQLSKLKRGQIRKLSIVEDPEAKSRIIAIFDFWSQQWLKQIHKIHFTFLKRIETDRTFTQDPWITSKPLGHKYYSFDLSAATDRFPIALQEELIKKMFGEDTSTRWRMILTTFPFYVPWEDKLIYYNAGQPMGAYSSWSTFTITHHVVLQYIHKNLGLTEMYYQILGDDIVIYHDEVAKEYQRLMKELEVDISIPKSNISSEMYEFAKRVIIKGREVTGIQIRGLLENHSKYHLLYQMVYEIIYSRGYTPVRFQTIPDLLYLMMKNIGMKEKFALNIKSRVTTLHAFNKFLDGNITPFLDDLKRRYPHYEGSLELNQVELNNWIYLSMSSIFNKVNGDYIRYAHDLINRPIAIEQAAIGLADPSDIWTSPIYYLTKLPVIEALRNTIRSLNRSRKLESIKDMVKAIALPDSDIFEKRGSIRLIGAYAKLAKITIATFEHHVIQGRLAAIPDPNLGSQVLDHIVSDMRTYQIDKSHGLIPPAPKPPVTPQKSIYDASAWI